MKRNQIIVLGGVAMVASVVAIGIAVYSNHPIKKAAAHLPPTQPTMAQIVAKLSAERAGHDITAVVTLTNTVAIGDNKIVEQGKNIATFAVAVGSFDACLDVARNYITNAPLRPALDNVDCIVSTGETPIRAICTTRGCSPLPRPGHTY